MSLVISVAVGFAVVVVGGVATRVIQRQRALDRRRQRWLEGGR